MPSPITNAAKLVLLVLTKPLSPQDYYRHLSHVLYNRDPSQSQGELQESGLPSISLSRDSSLVTSRTSLKCTRDRTRVYGHFGHYMKISFNTIRRCGKFLSKCFCRSKYFTGEPVKPYSKYLGNTKSTVNEMRQARRFNSYLPKFVTQYFTSVKQAYAIQDLDDSTAISVDSSTKGLGLLHLARPKTSFLARLIKKRDKKNISK